jgi:hypothetical protein
MELRVLARRDALAFGAGLDAAHLARVLFEVIAMRVRLYELEARSKRHHRRRAGSAHQRLPLPHQRPSLVVLPIPVE